MRDRFPNCRRRRYYRIPRAGDQRHSAVHQRHAPYPTRSATGRNPRTRRAVCCTTGIPHSRASRVPCWAGPRAISRSYNRDILISVWQVRQRWSHRAGQHGHVGRHTWRHRDNANPLHCFLVAAGASIAQTRWMAVSRGSTRLTSRRGPDWGPAGVGVGARSPVASRRGAAAGAAVAAVAQFRWSPTRSGERTIAAFDLTIDRGPHSPAGGDGARGWITVGIELS